MREKSSHSFKAFEKNFKKEKRNGRERERGCSEREREREINLLCARDWDNNFKKESNKQTNGEKLRGRGK